MILMGNWKYISNNFKEWYIQKENPRIIIENELGLIMVLRLSIMINDDAN